jgi:hypothetical protein
MDAFLRQLVFSVGDEQYLWEDVILSARVRGEWADLENELREGLACLQRFDEEEGEIDPAELRSAANDFRYARDLVSAEETERWLNRWHLNVEEWMEYLQRRLLRQKWADQLAEIQARFRVAKKEIQDNILAEAICSGHLARCARALAARAAARAKALAAGWIEHTEKGAEAAARVHGLEEGYRRFCDHVIDSRGLKVQVDCHRLDWIRFDCRYALFPHEHMAREAALCARDDGISLDEIAANANIALHEAAMYLDEIEPSRRSRFLAAEKGALLGPLDWDNNAVGVFLIADKILPTLEDPRIKQRAQEALLEIELNREIANRVKWHARL